MSRSKNNVSVLRNVTTRVGVESPLDYVSCYVMGNKGSRKVELDYSVTEGNRTQSFELHLSRHATWSLVQSLQDVLSRIAEEDKDDKDDD